MKNFKLKFSEYMQNISRSKSFGKFVLIMSLNQCRKTPRQSKKDALRMQFNLNKRQTFRAKINREIVEWQFWAIGQYVQQGKKGQKS